DIGEVIAVAAAAAIVGDNLGYWIGRTAGRSVLERFGRFQHWSKPSLEWSERFFQRHGGKTVFIARFVAVLRVTAAWMAGISHMPWGRFFAWNAAGGVCWAVLVGLGADLGGPAAADAIGRYGFVGGAAVVGLVVLAAVALHFWRKRLLRTEPES